MTATGIFLGTPGFFSPEQTSGGELGPPSDVFSLGAVLTFAATGSAPFGEETTTALLYQVVHDEPDLSEVPGGLRRLITACLAKDPAARPTPSAILDGTLVGDRGVANPQDGWLPPAIDALVREHTTELPKAPDPPRSAPAQPAPAQPAPAQQDPSRGPAHQPPAASQRAAPPAPTPPPPAAPPASARPPAPPPAPPATSGPAPVPAGNRQVAAPGGCARIVLWGFVGLLVLFVALVFLGVVFQTLG